MDEWDVAAVALLGLLISAAWMGGWYFGWIFDTHSALIVGAAALFSYGMLTAAIVYSARRRGRA